MILSSINISLNHSGKFRHALSLDRLQCPQFLRWRELRSKRRNQLDVFTGVWCSWAYAATTDNIKDEDRIYELGYQQTKHIDAILCIK
jgi:hypothetical protein